MIQFKRMSLELRSTMSEPNSALRLFLRHCPDSIGFFLDQCLFTLCQDQVNKSHIMRDVFDPLMKHCDAQIQGEIYHDFFTTNIDVPNTATADDEVKFKFEAFRGVYDLMVVTEKGRWVSLLRKNFKLKDTAYIVSRMPL